MKYPPALFAEYQALMSKQTDMELSAQDQRRLRTIKSEMRAIDDRIDDRQRTEEDLSARVRGLKNMIKDALDKAATK